MISILTSTVASALPSADAQWAMLQEANPRIECTESGGEPWCRSVGIVGLPIDRVAPKLEDMAAHQGLFDSIVSIKVLAPDTMHITLDYPFPFADRDYVAQFTRLTEGAAKVYRWAPVTRPEAPEVDGVVRLPKMAGEWRLEPSGSQTKVTYLWQAEVPGMAAQTHNIARRKAGNEAIKDIAKAAAAN